MLYVNQSSRYTLSENIEFELDGCVIEGVYSNYVEIVVKPGKERMLKINKNQDAGSFEAKIAKLHYNIE